MWKKSYKTNLVGSGVTPNLFAEANHDGYEDEYSVTHTRKVEWPTPEAGGRTIYRLTGSDSLLKIIVRNINGGRK